MSENKNFFSKEIIKELKKWEKRYPKNRKLSVLIPGLHILQDFNNGYLTIEHMDNLAKYLDVPKTSVYEVATFYSMYDLQKVGKYKLNVCTNISCMLNGSGEILNYLEKKLNIKNGETTSDNKITLRSVECQGACCGAPMLEVNKVFYENLTFDKIDSILDSLE